MHAERSTHPAIQLSLALAPHREPHLVRTVGKRPIDRGWQRNRPAPSAVDLHLSRGGDLGYIPESVGGIVLDVDGSTDARPLEDLLGRPLATTTSVSGRGLHVLYGTESDYRPARGCKGKFRVGDVRGDWLWSRSFALETIDGWRTLADADWTAPAAPGYALDTVLTAGAAAPSRTAASTGRLGRLKLYSDGPLCKGVRNVGLLYRTHVEAGRLLATGTFSGDEQDMVALVDALNDAHCIPRLHGMETWRIARSANRYWIERAETGHCPAWIAKQARRGRRSGAVRRQKQRNRWSRTWPLFEAGLTVRQVAEQAHVSPTTAGRDRQAWLRARLRSTS